MKLIHNTNTNAHYNLALEEYLLKSKDFDIFMVWQNKNAVIVGRNQNTHNEVDAENIKRHGVQVVRRLTGGGAVYHDMGNINYTYIMRGASEHFNDYKYFAAPIVAFLRKIGIAADMSGRNDIVCGDKKISGTAQVKHGEDVLFHGTLLVDTDINMLTACLTPEVSKLTRHGIKSVSSRVMNLKTGVAEMIDMLIAEAGAERYELTPEDIAETEKLMNEKYATDEWNYGDFVAEDLGE